MDSQGINHVEKQAQLLTAHQMQQDDCSVSEQLAERQVLQLLSAPWTVDETQKRCSLPAKKKHSWVACDKCQKWRRVPKLPSKSRWSCDDNLDEDYDDCNVPQELSNEAIDKELEAAQCSTTDDGVVPDGTGSTRADGAVRLWSCVCQLPIGSRVNSKSLSELLGCAQKLGKLLRDPQIVRLMLPSDGQKQSRRDSRNKFKGAWTVHGVAFMCLARVYTLKATLSQRASVEQQIP